MDDPAAATTSSYSEYVSWEESNVVVLKSGGRREREVRYYLKRRGGGGRDLVVVGREGGERKGHVAYRYVGREESERGREMVMKMRSRREVVEWLDSAVSGTPQTRGTVACELDVETLKENQLKKFGHYTAEFDWLGNPWTCKKKRKHYSSFLRNGVKISVNDFVYVFAEENKRLVALLDDMYVDSRGNRMVVVRWFHKIDEVGIILPHNHNDKEVFFSLCLQDLSIECIDGLATILAPQHYEKLLARAQHARLEPFLCRSLFDNDEIKPFDITQLKGYWKQEILKYGTSGAALPKTRARISPSETGVSDSVVSKPKKRLRLIKEDEESLNANLVDSKVETDVSKPKNYLDSRISLKQDRMRKPPQLLTVGSQIEVLSQDSGLRGCWFRAVVMKKHKNKVKVQYEDIRDAENEANNLQEWVFASKVADADALGLRIAGRSTIRPIPATDKEGVSLSVRPGTVVDVWWHDGWWEAIVLQKENEDKILVYLPGEKQKSTFACGELRISKEWLGNKWLNVKARPDLVDSLFSNLSDKPMVDMKDSKQNVRIMHNDKELPRDVHKECLSVKDEKLCNKPQEELKELVTDRDPLKVALLDGLKWKSSRRRTPCIYSRTKSSPKNRGSRVFDSFFVSNTLQLDRDNCKFSGDSHFSSSVVPALTSLVMSR